MPVANTLCLLAGPLLTLPRGYHVNPVYPLEDRVLELNRLQGLENITSVFKFWMYRVLLQTVWRWRQLCDPDAMISTSKVGVLFAVLFNIKDSIPIVRVRRSV
jgi:hypothetical protein